MEVLTQSCRKPRRAFLASVLACLLTWGFNARGQAPTPSEWDVKTVLLFNMAQFVEWPTSAFPSTNSPLIIGVLGADPFGNTLDSVVRGESVNGRPLVVRRFASASDARSCHILYISTRASSEVAAITAQLRQRPILTVGESQNFARRDGGMIQFFVSPQGKIRLRINLANANAAGLRVSSKLLRVSEVLETSS